MNLISVKFLKFILLTHPLIVFCEGCQKFSSTSLPWLDCGLLPKGFNDQDGTDYDNYDEDDDQGVICGKLIKKEESKKQTKFPHDTKTMNTETKQRRQPEVASHQISIAGPHFAHSA